MLTLADIEAAAARIAGRVRRTPLLDPQPCDALPPGVVLKLELLQVTGSFKARGALSKLLSLDEAAFRRGLVTASGGNHGVAVAYAGRQAGVPATVFVPANIAPAEGRSDRGPGCAARRRGRVLGRRRRRRAPLRRGDGGGLPPPLRRPAVVAGQGTLALEILVEAPDLDTLLIAIGGGGLIAGVAVAAKALKPGIRVVGVESGCPTLERSLAAGRVVELERVETVVPTLAARRTDPFNFEICRCHVERVVLVSDDAMREAARTLWRELGLAADMSGAASVAALMSGAYHPARASGSAPSSVGRDRRDQPSRCSRNASVRSQASFAASALKRRRRCRCGTRPRRVVGVGLERDVPREHGLEGRDGGVVLGVEPGVVELERRLDVARVPLRRRLAVEDHRRVEGGRRGRQAGDDPAAQAKPSAATLPFPRHGP